MSNNTPKPAPGAVVYDEAAIKRKLVAALRLLALFCTVYFTAAVIATKNFAQVAGTLVFGLPVALYAGVLVFVVGVIVTRMCLAQDKGN